MKIKPFLNSLKIENCKLKINEWYLTVTKGNVKISQTSEIETPPVREINKPATDSFKCPYCFSTRFVRRGTRQKKLESVQLYLCNDCGKTFTQHLTKGKHYPLPIILDALAIYHLGYSLEQTCKIVNERSKKETSVAGGLSGAGSNLPLSDTRSTNATTTTEICQESDVWRRVRESNPDPCGSISVSNSPRNRAGSPSNHETSIANTTVNLQPSTLANWLTEFTDLCRFDRMREFALKKYATRTAAFVLQSVKDRKLRHEAIQKFFLACDSVTIATEVPVYITSNPNKIEKVRPITKKSAFADLVRLTSLRIDWPDNLARTLTRLIKFVNGVWTRRELNPVDLGYQTNLANLPNPHHNYSIKNI